MKSRKLHRRRFVESATVSAVFLALQAYAGDVIKDNNADALNLGSSWVGGTAPGAADIARFDTSIIGIGTNTYDYSADLLWNQLRVDLVSGSAAGGSVILDSTTSNTITVNAFRAAANVGTTTSYLTESGILLNSSAGASLTINDAVIFAPTSNSAALLTSSRNVTLNGSVGFGANTLDVYAAGGITNIAGALTGSGKVTD